MVVHLYWTLHQGRETGRKKMRYSETRRRRVVKNIVMSGGLLDELLRATFGLLLHGAGLVLTRNRALTLGRKQLANGGFAS